MSKYSPSFGIALSSRRYVFSAVFRVFVALVIWLCVVAIENDVSQRSIFVLSVLSGVDTRLAFTFLSD